MRVRRDTRGASVRRGGRGRAVRRRHGRTGPSPRTRGRFWSCREAEVDDVAVLDDVLFAFQAHLAVVAPRGHRSAGDQMIVADDLRANESAGDVAVDLSGRDLRRRMAGNGPGAALVLAHREERDVAEGIAAGAGGAGG